MKWNTTGNYRQYAPQALKDLPLELQRSHQYPRNPEAVGEAMQDYLDGEHKPEYIPQSMSFRRWKTPPYNQAWLSSTAALFAASQEDVQRITNLAAAGMPHIPGGPIGEQAQQYEQMPQPLDNMPRSELLSADDVTQLGVDYDARMYQLGEDRAGAAMDALQEIKSQAAQFEDFVNAPEDGPWIDGKVTR